MKLININKIILPLLIFISVVFLMNPSGYKINENEIFTLKNIQILTNEYYNAKEEVADLKILIEQKKNQLVEYEKAIDEDNGIKGILEEDIEYMKMYCGLTDVRGKGIMVKISDNMRNTGGNIKLDIVHDIDIAAIINELRNAGAEAISINGKRIINSTEIVCVGPLIKINGEGVAAPFVISAIGNQDLLSASINAPNTYAYKIEEEYGIDIDTRRSEDISIPKHPNIIKINYLESIEKGR